MYHFIRYVNHLTVVKMSWAIQPWRRGVDLVLRFPQDGQMEELWFFFHVVYRQTVVFLRVSLEVLIKRFCLEYVLKGKPLRMTNWRTIHYDRWNLIVEGERQTVRNSCTENHYGFLCLIFSFLRVQLEANPLLLGSPHLHRLPRQTHGIYLTVLAHFPSCWQSAGMLICP